MTITRLSSPQQNLLRALVATIALAAPSVALAATISKIATIPGVSDGGTPNTGLTKLGGGYYGTTSGGGSGSGTVYRIDLKTRAESVLHAFNGNSDGRSPQQDLLAVAGKLYGTTIMGGSAGFGTVFAIDSVTGAEQVLFNLPVGYTNPDGALVEVNGLLYGTGCVSNLGKGCIFSVDPVAATGQIIYNFTGVGGVGNWPSGLTRHNNSLYGVTYEGGYSKQGTLFAFDLTTHTLRTEHMFGKNKDGSKPAGSLTNVGGILYGTTQFGGANGDGTAFSFDPGHRQEVILHSFDGIDGSYIGGKLLNAGGLLYGTGQEGGANGGGVLFSVNPTTGQTTTVYSFSLGSGFSNLIEANGLLYGTLQQGGPAPFEGLVYSVDPATATLATVHDFKGTLSSFNSGLIQVHTSLFGVTSNGGKHALGSLYKVDPATGALETLHSFSGGDGSLPTGSLIDVAGVLYGVTSPNLGAAGFGTVFSYDVAHHRLTTVYQFTGGTDGGNPVGTLALANGGLYGTTPGVGGAPDGAIFRIDLSSGAFATVATGTDPYSPSSLISAGGLLYGEGAGVLYQFDPASGVKTSLYSIPNAVPGFSYISPLYDNGVLFGETPSYDRHTPATVFSYDIAMSSHSNLHTFKKYDQLAGPLVASGDKLYGFFEAHELGTGISVLRLNVTTGAAIVFPFSTPARDQPDPFLLHVGQAYYCTTQSNQDGNAGAVFKFVP